MEISLVGRKALVGGASRGLGKAIALQLAECGAEVTVMARNRPALEELVATMPRAHGQRHNFLAVDFSRLADFDTEVHAWFKDHSVDILVNNTNGPAAGGVLEKGVDEYQQAFDLLFKTVCLVTLEAVKGMQQAGFGRIINLSSVSVKEPLQNLVLSNTVRSAVLAWAKTLARDVAPMGITVNNLLTGFFDTERLNEIQQKQSENSGASPETLKEDMKRGIPMGRFGDPAEFGHLVAFLSSDYASYITGANIPIDGGLLRSV